MSEWNFVTLFIASVFQELMYKQKILVVMFWWNILYFIQDWDREGMFYAALLSVCFFYCKFLTTVVF